MYPRIDILDLCVYHNITIQQYRMMSVKAQKNLERSYLYDAEPLDYADLEILIDIS